MIRLSLLQLRVQAITGAAVLAAFAVLLLSTGPHLARLYAASGLSHCQPASWRPGPPPWPGAGP